MNLRQKITPEEVMKSPPIEDGIGIYGIVDNLGIDQLFRTDEEKQGNIKYMKLRCRYNSSRNPRIFYCIIKKKYVPKFDMNKPMDLYNELRQRAVTFKEENY